MLVSSVEFGIPPSNGVSIVYIAHGSFDQSMGGGLLVSGGGLVECCAPTLGGGGTAAILREGAKSSS